MNPDQQPFQLNPAIRILHRKGVLFAGQMSGLAQPVQLLEFDVLMLHLFLAGAPPQQVAQELLQGPSRALFTAVPSGPALMNRMQQLAQAQVLIPGDQQRATQATGSSVTAMALTQCPPAPALSGQPLLRLGVNIALRPGHKSYRIWSPRQRMWYLPDPALLALLLFFVEPRNAAEALAARSHLAAPEVLEQGIRWLLHAGLVIEDQAQQLGPNSRAEARVQGASHALIGDGPRWTDIEPDGRIPVYFAPHMENHYPLALGMIAAAIEAHNEGELLERFQLLPISYLTPQQLMAGPQQKFGAGVWLFSNYMWSLDVNLEVGKLLKARDAGNLTIHGGPSTPGYPQACADFMNGNSSVDIAVHGEGEVSVVEILQCVSRSEDGRIGFDAKVLEDVQGLTFRSADQQLVNTATRTRLKEPDSIPSPYLRGLFDSYDGKVEAAIIESNRGCPFGCTFCDWGSATRQKVRKFDLQRVRDEIDWIGRHQVRVIWIADANFGMYDRDIELAEHIVTTRKKYGFPQEVVVNYTKNTTRRLVEIIKAFSAGGIISQGIISIQTTDEATLEVINRRNIKTDKYDELTAVFAEANLPLSTDLMIGLPGITPAAFDRDLQRYFDVDVSTKAYPTQLLPNSPMADPEYMEKYQIRVDDDDFIIACHSFNEADLADMKAIFNLFMVADGYAALRYVLRYLQWEHGIDAMACLHRLLEMINAEPARFATVRWVNKFFTTDKFVPGGWKSFYDEIADFALDAYGVERDSAFDTVLLVNELAMPDDTCNYPLEVELPHDFVSWFRDHNAQRAHEIKPLSNYGPGRFSVDDPDGMANIDMDYVQYDSHQYFWELRSPTARAKSVSDVAQLRQASQGD